MVNYGKLAARMLRGVFGLGICFGCQYGEECRAASLRGRLVLDSGLQEDGKVPKERFSGVAGALVYLVGEQPAYIPPKIPPPPITISVAVVRTPRVAVVVPEQRIVFMNRGPDIESVYFKKAVTLKDEGRFSLLPGQSHETWFRAASGDAILLEDEEFSRDIKIICSPPGCACVSDAEGRFELKGFDAGERCFGFWHPEHGKNAAPAWQGGLIIDFEDDRNVDLDNVEIVPKQPR